MSPPRDPFAEIEALNKRVDELEEKFARELAAGILLAKSEAQAVVDSGFNGVKAYLALTLPQAAATAVAGELAPIKIALRDLLKMATDTEVAREKRLRDEKDAADKKARDLDLDAKGEDVEAKRIKNASGRHAVNDQPFATKFSRQMKVVAAIATLIAAVTGGGIWSALSHH